MTKPVSQMTEEEAERMREQSRKANRKRRRSRKVREKEYAANRARYHSKPPMTPTMRNAQTANRRFRLHGVTPEEFRAMWLAQNKRCPLCDKRIALKGKGTHLDHCHKTGHVRGRLVCAL